MEVVKNKGKFVLKDGDRILSWIAFEENDEIHLIETVTVEDAKGKGYASKLVEEVLKKLEGKNVKVSCPYIKSRIEKKGLKGKFRYTPLLKLKEEIEKFNRYRSPEAHAELLEFEKRRAKVLFTGPFCVSCGIYDYFEDVIVDLNAKVERFEEFEEGFVVTYLFNEDLY
ncbi:GNAT family N-acetyltransferase [Ferroglobus sp.]|uniref:GNAT family N-acetyltransferase n=1 Tax=Ferroglobus sp. TaxID=2614230 RepID=UPI0025BC97D9|nr:GNAT family N-acetyltransferase [Ferroglobus sp.]